MPRYKINVNIKNSHKEIVKNVKKTTHNLDKESDINESIIWELLEGLPSGNYEFEWLERNIDIESV